MFDISLGELAVIGAVALVVIGPEKLPKVARTAGLLFGRAQRMAAGFRADLERELQASEVAELRKSLTEDAANFRDEMAESAAGVAAAFSIEENRIQPTPAPAAGTEPPRGAVTTAAQNPAPSKPRRSRMKTEVASEAVSESAPEILAAPVKKPRKRKQVVEPEAPDLFAEPAPETLPDTKDRR